VLLRLRPERDEPRIVIREKREIGRRLTTHEDTRGRPRLLVDPEPDPGGRNPDFPFYTSKARGCSRAARRSDIFNGETGVQSHVLASS
jgi:hypothetical protein